MFIKTRPVPEELKKAIAESLRNQSHARFLAEAAGGSADADVTLSFPHEAYFMPLDAIAQGRSLDDAAYQTATRVLLSDSRQHVYAAAEVSSQGTGAERTQLDKSAFLEPMLEGLGELDKSGYKLMYQDLDPRLLRIPALYIMAIWLHGDAGPVNLVMPIGPTPPPLVANRVYRAQEFLTQIQGLAKERMEQDKLPPAGLSGGTR